MIDKNLIIKSALSQCPRIDNQLFDVVYTYDDITRHRKIYSIFEVINEAYDTILMQEKRIKELEKIERIISIAEQIK